MRSHLEVLHGSIRQLTTDPVPSGRSFLKGKPVDDTYMCQINELTRALLLVSKGLIRYLPEYKKWEIIQTEEPPYYTATLPEACEYLGLALAAKLLNERLNQ